MPLYSDLGLYGSPSASSYSAGLYLSGPYSNHSSLVSSIYRSPVYTKPLPRTFPRNYSPHLATISENQIISPLRRKFSPKLLLEHHSSPKFKVPKPIKINTADIDVSVNKYRKYDRNSKITPDPKISPEKSKSPSPSAPDDQVPELPDNKPIRRDRALVRLHTVHKRDSPRKNINQNGEMPKSWRSNFYADELFKVDEKKPKRSPGELLMDKFLIRTKEEEDRLRAEGRKLPRKQPVQKTSSFHDICTHISTDAIDENEDLNPGQPPDITRRQSKGEDILEEDENNNTKRKKKVTKKKSNDKLVPEEHKTNLHRRHTHKKIKRTSTDASIPSEDEEIIKDISQVEIEEVKKPKFTATVDIDNVEHSPSLKAIIDEVEIVESPSQTLLGKKFKFNVTVEEIKETPNKAKAKSDLPESKLNVLDSAMAVKREKSKSPARDFTKPKSLDLKSTTTAKLQDAKPDLKASPTKDTKADLKSPDSPTSPKMPKSKVIAKKATSPKSPTSPPNDSTIAPTASDEKVASPTKVKDLKSPQENKKIISTKCDDKTTTKLDVATPQIPDDGKGVEAKKQSSISITLIDNKVLPKTADNKSPPKTPSDLAVKSSAVAAKKDAKSPEETKVVKTQKSEDTSIDSPKIQDVKLQKPVEIALKTSEVKASKLEDTQIPSPKTPTDVKTPKLEDKIATPKTQDVKLPKAEETKVSTIKTPQELKTCEGTQITPKPPLEIKTQKLEETKTPQESKVPETKMQDNKTSKSDEIKITTPKIPTTPIITPQSIKEEAVTTPKTPQEKTPKLEEVKAPVLSKTILENTRPTTPTSPTTPDNLKTSKLLEAQKKVKAQKTKITPKLAPKEENTSGENFWAKLGTRETVYLDHRRRKMQEKRFATLILPEENGEVEGEKVDVKPAQNKLALDKEKKEKDKLKLEVKKDESPDKNKPLEFNKVDLNKAKLPEKIDAQTVPSPQIEAKLNKQVDDKPADLTKDVAKDVSTKELKTNKAEAKTDKGFVENNLKTEVKGKLEEDAIITKTEIATQVDKSKDKDQLEGKDKDKLVDKLEDKSKSEDKFKGKDKLEDKSKNKDKLEDKILPPKPKDDIKIKTTLEGVKSTETLKILDGAKAGEAKAKEEIKSTEEALKSKPVDAAKIEAIEAISKKPLDVLKSKSVEESLKPLDVAKVEAIETSAKKPLEALKTKAVEEPLKAKPVDAAKVEANAAKIKKPAEETLKTKLAEETIKVKPIEIKPNEDDLKVKSVEALKAGGNEAKNKSVEVKSVEAIEAKKVEAPKMKPLDEMKDKKVETSKIAAKVEAKKEEPLKIKPVDEMKDKKVETSKIAAKVETKKEEPLKIKPVDEMKDKKVETSKIAAKEAKKEEPLKIKSVDEVKDKKLETSKIAAKIEAPKSPLLGKLDKTLQTNEVKKAKPKKEKAEDKKKEEALKSVITSDSNPVQNAELSGVEKKLVSKRSLLNKDVIEDPDLNVFVVPTPRTPTPPPQKDPEPPQFVPLQSNRLTQWMHPFKKPEQYDECPVQLYARPKTIRHRHYPKPRHLLPDEAKPEDEELSESEEEDDDDDVEDDVEEEESSESGSGDEEGSSDEETSDSVDYEAINDVWGYGKVGASTSSDDSGFDSSSLDNRKNKDCDVNCHKKCEKLTANLCGVNQKLIVEAIESVKKGCSERDSPTSNPAHNPVFALDPAELAEEFSQSSTFAGFQKSGRITPPATTIPRFRKYNIEDFNFLKVLGKGSFGKVLLAELKDTEYYYAIKCLKKDVVLEDDDVECTLIERKVLALGTKHPYLCHLLCTFQTESHLFFVMEYLNGGDLMFHIQLSGRFPEPRARFYAAEIVSGLKFLHSKGIVYRDLKLDNILLDFDGHVRIADFGMCKLQIFLDRTADTFCGTPDYMAPEIIKGQHYNQMVDWWSFGVLLYEMLIGQSPFSGCDEDELFWSICNERPVLPRFLSKEASKILTLFLEKDGAKRLGNKFCHEGDIQDQQFFHPIDWGLLNLRQLEPPFKPNLQHPLDTQYFDRTFTVEKAKLTPIDKNILQSMDQAQFQGFSYTNPNATDR